MNGIAAIFMVFLLLAGMSSAAAIMADHRAVADFDKIPSYWLEKAKELDVTYGHTSHGSQVITGLGMVKARYGGTYAYGDDYHKPGTLASGTLSLWDGRMSGASDLGNPNLYAWVSATRNHLDGPGKSRSVVMWSWCGQVSGAKESDITTNYLGNMASLERDYPGVTFIYMTGHTDGTGDDGNLNKRNEQIRKYVEEHGGVLFDFADIESWDPGGNYHADAKDSCEWCSAWCADYPSDCANLSTSCAHSHQFNCLMKGKAYWWLMARLAGWNGTTDDAAGGDGTTQQDQGGDQTGDTIHGTGDSAVSGSDDDAGTSEPGGTRSEAPAGACAGTSALLAAIFALRARLD